MHLDDLPMPSPWHVRLLGKIELAPSGCWIWMASCRPDGYGQIWTPLVGGRRSLLSAHRAVYELARGEIPEGLDLDHLCRVRRCVNPLHLEPVTRAENILRGECPAARNARRRRCADGHMLVPLTTGKRGCPICRPTLRAA